MKKQKAKECLGRLKNTIGGGFVRIFKIYFIMELMAELSGQTGSGIRVRTRSFSTLRLAWENYGRFSLLFLLIVSAGRTISHNKINESPFSL